MNRSLWVALLLFSPCHALSQDIQVNRQNKTIAVTADQSISVESEVAVVERRNCVSGICH